MIIYQQFFTRFTAILIVLAFAGCDGTHTSESTTSELKFSKTELVDTVWFSSELLQRSIDDGFIFLFDDTNVEEIGFVLTSPNAALVGDYDWTLVNDKLQITYPSARVCTTTKEEVNSLEIEVSAVCDNGLPTNAVMENTVLNPLSLSPSNLSGKTMSITVDANTAETLIFAADGTFTLNRNENGVQVSSELGTYDESLFNDVIRLEFQGTQRYRLLFLADGSLTDGLILEQEYNAAATTGSDLQSIRFYSVFENTRWRVDDRYDTFTQDN